MKPVKPETLVVVDAKEGTLTIPHLGYTVRRLMGAALEAQRESEFRRKWKILYNGVPVGTLQLKSEKVAK